MVSKRSIIGVVLLELAVTVLGQQPLYGQCGGNDWDGPTDCVAGACCTVGNEWYSQCLPGDCGPGGGMPTNSTGPGIPTTSSGPGMPINATRPGMPTMTSVTRLPTNSTGPGIPTSTSGSGMPTTTPITGGLAAADVSTGCGRTSGLESGTFTITSSGQEREYILSLPENYDSASPYKLIFGLHWLSGTMQNVVDDSFYGVQPLSENKVIFVAPQGLDNGWANTDDQDITLIDDILATLEEELCIEKTQIFAMGFSYGGAMSYSLACSRPEVFRGVAVMSGALLSGCAPGTEPVGYYGQHGGSDDVLAIAMGRQIRDTFVTNNGCTPQETEEPSAGSGTHVKTEYEGCSDDHPVWWVPFDGPHVATGTDAGSDASWTPDELWSFFSQFA